MHEAHSRNVPAIAACAKFQGKCWKINKILEMTTNIKIKRCLFCPKFYTVFITLEIFKLIILKNVLTYMQLFSYKIKQL